MKICITGSTDGIGKETARQLLQLGHSIVMTGRDTHKSRQAREELAGEARRHGAAEPALHTADFAVLEEVRGLGRELAETHPDLQVLINNAGIQTPRRRETPEGLEMVFTVNHLAPFLLTNLLLPTLKENAPARVVNVSSMVHEHAAIDLDDLMLEQGWEPYRAYGQSKLANVLFTRELAGRLEASGVSVNALHPGVISTKLLHTMFSGGSSPEKGARTPVYLAVSPEVEGITGRYFRDRHETRSPALEGSGAQARRLWEISARLTGLDES